MHIRRPLIPLPLRQPLETLARSAGMDMLSYIHRVLADHVQYEQSAGRLPPPPEASPAQRPSEGRVRAVSSRASRFETRFQPWSKC